MAFNTAWNDSMRHCQNISFGKQHLPISNTNYPQNDLERELLSILAECAESITARSKSQGETAVEYLGKWPSMLSSGGNGNIRIIGRIRTRTSRFFMQYKVLRLDFPTMNNGQIALMYCSLKHPSFLQSSAHALPVLP